MRFLQSLAELRGDHRKRIKVEGKEMVAAFMAGCDNYIPVFNGHEMLEEGGVTQVSFNNLQILIKKLGNPIRVECRNGGDVLIHFSGDKFYLATGFGVGYMGTGSYYFALFGERVGFGDCYDLYDKISLLPRDFVGVVWETV